MWVDCLLIGRFADRIVQMVPGSPFSLFPPRIGNMISVFAQIYKSCTPPVRYASSWDYTRHTILLILSLQEVFPLFSALLTCCRQNSI